MNISKGTLARTIILLLALINQIAAAFGKSPLPIDDETVTAAVSAVWTIAASIVAFWKNNSFTSEAIKADEYMKSLKESKGDE